MTTFLISDTHFGHANILAYEPVRLAWGCSTVAEMNELLADRWNAVVRPADVVIHLGDFAMGKSSEWPRFRNRLNGRIWLVPGNHDRRVETWALPVDRIFSAETTVTFAFKTGMTFRARHIPARFTPEDREWSVLHNAPLVHGHTHSRPTGGKRNVCVSIERLPAPQPMPISELADLWWRQRQEIDALGLEPTEEDEPDGKQTGSDGRHPAGQYRTDQTK